MYGLYTGIFWASLLGIAYTYVGYGLLMALLARWQSRPVRRADITPTVTVLVAAYNEQDCIAQKIENTLSLDYPPDKLDLLIVTDGSTDETNAIVAAYANRGVRLLYEPERRGKPAALIRAWPHVTGEIVVFSDANSYFRPDTLRRLVRPFADPQVGGVSGSKRIVQARDSLAEQGEGLYWRYETALKRWDSAVRSVMGVPGEVWAARRTAYRLPEANSLIEDFVASLRMVAAGWRVVMEPEAIAYEEASPGLRAEWIRRTRIAAGGWQAFFQLPEMLRLPDKLVTFQYLSHRMARWMVTPVLFVTLLLSNVALVHMAAHPFYAATLAIQLLGYALGALGGLLAARGRRVGWLLAPFYVLMLNAAALVGGWRYLTRRQSVVWRKAR
ncbi:MAG: glycosyltransferase family 2 protein [Chloroflexi bacterium]|jgi:biofilm PGA synthesis N-glycosyltransferase PgaC|nr:glycosyltransferase family 2 protein [Chloroflexota bacterium]